MLPSLACGSPTLGSRVRPGSLTLRLGAECWALAKCGDRELLFKKVMLSLAAAEWRLLFKLKVSVEQEEGCCPAPLRSSGSKLPLLCESC